MILLPPKLQIGWRTGCTAGGVTVAHELKKIITKPKKEKQSSFFICVNTGIILPYLNVVTIQNRTDQKARYGELRKRRTQQGYKDQFSASKNNLPTDSN